MGANLRIVNTATFLLIGLQLIVPSYVGAVENSSLSMMTSIVEVEQAEKSGGYEPPDNDGPGASVGGGSR